MILLGASGDAPKTVANMLPTLECYYKHDGFTLSTDSITQWDDASSNGRDLAPTSSSPTSKRYVFSGRRGMYHDQTLEPAAELTISPPYDVWVAICPNALSGVQRIFQSTDGGHTRFLIQTNGSLRARINAVNIDVAPAAAVVADTLNVIRFTADASGNLTTEVNGTAHDESASSTDSFKFGLLGHAAAASDSWIGAFAIFSQQLDANQQTKVRNTFNEYKAGSIHMIGMSNTNDALDGWLAINGTRGIITGLTGYNSQTLKNWYDDIGAEANAWVTFNGKINRTSATGGFPFISAIWMQTAISPTNAGTALSTMQTWATDVIAKARDLLDAAGYSNGATMPFYISPMAYYTTAAQADCNIVSSGAWQKSFDLYEWVIANITGCSAGPILPEIDVERADGVITSACHVAEYWKKDDGLCLDGFFRPAGSP